MMSNPWASDAPSTPSQPNSKRKGRQVAEQDIMSNPWATTPAPSSSHPTPPTQAPPQSSSSSSSTSGGTWGWGASSKAASPTSAPSTSQALAKIPEEFLLIVFIHGFKGADTTFEEFPERLQHILTQTMPNLKVECLVFPAYDTKGDLDKAVVKFADWLTNITVEREIASGGGAGKAKIVICGHSMGGLLAADSLREFVNTRPDAQSPLWPRIIACLAFDTPYLGLNPALVRNGVTKAADHVSTATTLGSALFGSLAGFTAGQAATHPVPTSDADHSTSSPSSSSQQQQRSEPPASGWAKWATPAAYAIGGAILAGAAAGGAYYAREHLNKSYAWLMDHMKYVGNLWDEPSLEKRVEALVDIEEQHGVVFRNFYTQIPPAPPNFLVSRTFVILPRHGTRAVDRFVSARNTLAADEIQAHTGMFSASTNDGYYDLGLSAAKVIRDAYHRSRASPPPPAASQSRRGSVSARPAQRPGSPQTKPTSRPGSRNSPRPRSPPVAPQAQQAPRRSPRKAAQQKQQQNVEEDLITF